MSVRIISNQRALDAVVLARTNALLGKLAYDIEAWAKIYAPVDTGFLMGSISSTQESDLSWIVQAAAGYAAYVELGTKRSSAQPYLVPAIMQVKKLARGAKGTFTTEGPAEP